MAHPEDEDDAHEDDGEVVLLLAPHRRLRVGPRRPRVVVAVVALRHRHLPLVPVLHVLVDLRVENSF